MKKFFVCCTLLVGVLITSACAKEESEDVMIGSMVKNGMEINAVYMPHAMRIEPKSQGGQEGNIHIEADIHATKDNQYGFKNGEWIPYLTINYTLQNLDGNKKQNGQLYQMVAGDPHYASNLKLEPGNYKLTYEISAPELARHADDVLGFYEPF
jgi:uncharacterized protein involved in high-affinity Fe2+ transport